jgi:hypothetical protein
MLPDVNARTDSLQELCDTLKPLTWPSLEDETILSSFYQELQATLAKTSFVSGLDGTQCLQLHDPLSLLITEFGSLKNFITNYENPRKAKNAMKSFAALLKGVGDLPWLEGHDVILRLLGRLTEVYFHCQVVKNDRELSLSYSFYQSYTFAHRELGR